MRVCTVRLFRVLSSQLDAAKQRAATKMDSFTLGWDAGQLPLSSSPSVDDRGHRIVTNTEKGLRYDVSDHGHVHHLSSTVESTLASLPYDNLHFPSCVGGASDNS